MDSIETTPQGTSKEATPEQPQTIEINGELVDVEELKKGYLRQSDYTRKTQELAKQREELQKTTQATPSDDEKAVDEYLRGKGYLTKAEAEELLKGSQKESQFERFFDANPELSKHEEAIKAIAKVDNASLEEIVVKYNFMASDKLQKAKSSRNIVGNSVKEEPKQKTIGDMTSAEYQKRKQEQGLSSKKGSFA